MSKEISISGRVKDEYGVFRRRPFVWEEEAVPRYVGLTPCWNCVSHAKAKGYAHVNILGRAHQVDRLIYEELFGFIPEGHVLRHKCDNRACINP